MDLRQTKGRGGVTRHDQHLDPLPLQMPRNLHRIASDGFRAFGSGKGGVDRTSKFKSRLSNSLASGAQVVFDHADATGMHLEFSPTNRAAQRREA